MADSNPTVAPATAVAPSPTAATAAQPAPAADDNDEEKAPSSNGLVKRKVCIYFGYVGERYCGLQYVKTAGIPTIEKEMLNALHRGDFISTNNVECEYPLQKNGWERASRTDKGVHALKNLISVRLQLPKEVTVSNDYTSCVAKLNTFLPRDIKVYKIQPVTGSFNAYMMCIGRRYQYYLPTFALCSKSEYDTFLPHDLAPQYIVEGETNDLFTEADRPRGEGEGCENAPEAAEGKMESASDAVGEKRGRNDTNTAASEDNHSADKVAISEAEDASKLRRANKDIKYGAEPMNVFKSIPEDTMRQLAEYRISAEGMERARRLFQMYVGTKPYHNFTPGGKPSDKSTIRYIQRITVNEPEILVPCLPEGVTDAVKQQHLSTSYPNGMEWVRIEIEGQSFMLNQIRKMIGNVICTMIMGLPDYFVSDALQSNVIRGIPMAPANGLFLSYLDFANYNHRLDKMKNQPNLDLQRKMYVDMDFEEKPIDPTIKSTISEAVYQQMCEEQVTTKDTVTEMHKQILATVGRRECVEDITGRWLRSARHVSRLAFRMDFGPEDDPSRYEKAPAVVIVGRTNNSRYGETADDVAGASTASPTVVTSSPPEPVQAAPQA